MLLNLVDPDPSNFLKDFPANNAVNCDRIDSYAGPCLRTQSLQSYTPVLTAATTNPNLGTGGTLVGKFYQIWDQVYVFGEFRFGTSASRGSGLYSISLPFKAKTLINTGNPFQNPLPIGTGIAFDTATDTNRQALTCLLATFNTMVFSTRMNTGLAGRGVTDTIPITWTGGSPGDGIMWSARYQRDLS